jgi:hypothetical protein
LHLIYQDGPHSFLYTVCNLSGEVTLRQTYDYVESRPRLHINEAGEIAVLGGVRRVVSNDVPPPKDDDDTSDLTARTAPPAKTNQVQTAKPPKT